MKPADGERDVLTVNVEAYPDHGPSVIVAAYMGPVAGVSGLLIGRIALTVRQSRVVGWLCRRVVRRVGGDE